MKPRLYIETSVISYYARRKNSSKGACDIRSDHRGGRRTRKEIEAEHGDDWKALERYFIDKQKSSPEKKAAYKPKKLPDRRTP